MSFSTTGLCSTNLICSLGGGGGSVSYNIRNCWCFTHQSLPRGSKVRFVVNGFRLTTKGCSRLIFNFGSLATMKAMLQVESVIQFKKIGYFQGSIELFQTRVGKYYSYVLTVKVIAYAFAWDS